jgi:hypothetical protein
VSRPALPATKTSFTLAAMQNQPSNVISLEVKDFDGFLICLAAHSLAVKMAAL